MSWAYRYFAIDLILLVGYRILPIGYIMLPVGYRMLPEFSPL